MARTGGFSMRGLGLGRGTSLWERFRSGKEFDGSDQALCGWKMGVCGGGEPGVGEQRCQTAEGLWGAVKGFEAEEGPDQVRLEND